MPLTSLTIQLFCKVEIAVGTSLSCHLNKLMDVGVPEHRRGSVFWVPLPRPNVLASWGCHNKAQQTGYPKIREIYSLTILETSNPKARCWQGPALTEGYRAGPVSASLLASGIGTPWLGQHNFHFCLCLHMAFPSVYVSLLNLPFSYKVTSCWIRAPLTPL